jgi:hypothetical protein
MAYPMDVENWRADADSVFDFEIHNPKCYNFKKDQSACLKVIG